MSESTPTNPPEASKPNTQMNQIDELDDAPYVDPESQDVVSVPQALKAGTVIIAENNLEALQTAYQQREAAIGTAAMITQVSIAGTYENLLLSAINDYSSEAERTSDVLARLTPEDLEKFSFLYRAVVDGKELAIGSSAVNNVPPKAGLTGEAAANQLLSSRKGKRRRILLPNSGFSIDVRCPSPDDVNTLLFRSRATVEEYGRMFGAHFYMYFDLILKNNFVDFFMSLVMLSSLQNWAKPGVLLSAIKVADYNLIMAEIAHLMYPDGYDDFVRLCTRPADHDHPNGCSHTVREKIRINHMIRTKYSRLSKEALLYLAKARNPAHTVSAQDVAKYQELLGFDERYVDFDGLRYYLRTPSIANYLEAGDVFNTELLNEVSANNTKGVYALMAFREPRTLLPYIGRIVALSEDDPTMEIPQTAFTDAVAVSIVLDQAVGVPDVEKGLIQKIVDFIGDTQLSAVCFAAQECEACGYVPKTDNGFISVDPQLMFFTTAYRKLTSAS